MKLTGQVGPQATAASDGVELEVRMGRTGGLVVAELHGRYFEQMRVGKMFSAANQAAQAVSVALATTYTGIMLYNPLGSGKILGLNLVKFAQSAAPSTFPLIGLLTGYAATGGVTAQTTKLTVQSNQIGNSAVGVGIALSAATIVTPTLLMPLSDATPSGTLPTAAIGPADIGGVFGILPGGFMGIYALTVATGLGGMSWEEVDMIGGGP